MFMCVRCPCRSSDFLLFVTNGFVVGVRSLKVTARHSNKAGASCEYPHCLSAMPRLALHNRRTQFNSPNTNAPTHTRCTLNCTAADREEGCREGGGMGGSEGGRE